MTRIALGTAAFIATTVPAMAAVRTVPGPEAGAGIAAMMALGMGLAWMRQRKNRG